MFFCNSLAFNPTIELPELTQDWEIDSWRAQTQPCVNQNPGERSSDPTRDWPRLAPECLGVSCGGVGRLCGCCGVQGHWEGQCLQETFWMKSRYLHCLHHGLASGQIMGREQAPPINRKLDWRFTEHGPLTSEQDPVSPSVSLSHQEASINLLSFSIRGQTEWKPQSQKTNQTDHIDHSLVSLHETINHAL